MDWRYIPFRHYDPYFKTGMNTALMESVAEGADPVVFLAGWKPDCINIGYSQKVEEEVDMKEFEKRENMVIVRRQGGGGTTYLTEKGEITWGMVAPEEQFPDDVNRIYRQVCGRIADALGEIGIEAWHEPVNDVVSDKGKLSGATLKKQNGAIYVGGTLLYDVDVEEMFSLLTPGKEKLRDKKINEFRGRVSSVTGESDATLDETREALKKHLLKDRKYSKTEMTREEEQKAQKLAEKYSSDEWVYRE